MAEPLRIEFEANTSKAQSAMASLAASIIANTATAGVALQGMAANTNASGSAIGALEQNVKRAALAIGSDVKSISSATAAAVTAEKATLASVVNAFTAAAASSTTAQSTVKAGISGTGTALATILALVPALGTIAATLGGVVAGYALLTAAVGQANEQLDKFIALGASAEKANVGVEFVQRFREAAEDAKLSVEQIDAALQRASQATRPKFEQEDPIRKQLTDIFESGYTGSFRSQGLADYIGARDAEGRIRAIVTAMRELQELGLQVGAQDLAEKVFGSDVADRIRSGRLEIEGIVQALNQRRDDLISQQQVQQAEEFREKLNQAYEEIDKALGVSVSLAGAGQAVNDIWLKIVQNVAEAAKQAGTFLDRMLAAAKAPLSAPQSSDLQSPLANRPRGEGEGSLGADLGAVAGRNARNGRTYDAPIGPQQPAGMIDSPPLPPRRPLEEFTRRNAATPSPGRGGGASEVDAVETFVNQLQKQAAALKAEAEAFNLSNAEKRIAIELAKANEVATANGTKVTDAQAASIRKLAEEAATAKDKIADLEQQQRQGAEAARYFGAAAADALGDLIIEGRSATEVLNNLVKSFQRSALQAIFTGQGPLAGLFQTAAPASAGPNAVGGLAGIISSFASFNPIPSFRANGGPVTAGIPYTVGEMGRELFVPGQSGQIVPLGRGGGGAPSFTSSPTFNVDARGSTMTEGQFRGIVAQSLSQYDRDLTRTFGQRLQEWRFRY